MLNLNDAQNGKIFNISQRINKTYEDEIAK